VTFCEEMKNPIITAIMFVLALVVGQAEESKCVPMKPGEVKVWESVNDRGKHLYRRWKVDSETGCEERIVMNSDDTVRGRLITTYRGGKQSMVISYKGMTEPWFAEHYKWEAEGGYSVERRSILGEVIFRQIFPSDDEGVVQTLDANGNEITLERYKELSDEVGELLF
jgi:hypothetical protein